MSQINVNKIISPDQSLTNGPSIDIASNGNVTVDTDTLYVDSANNRVGINESSPTRTLDIGGDRGFSLNSGLIRENINITGSAITGDSNHDINVAQAYLWNAASASWTPNFRYSGSATFASQVPVGQSIGFSIIVPLTTSSRYCLGAKIDGTSQTVEWTNGTAPTQAGSPEVASSSGYDVYFFQILRTGTGSTDYVVLAAQNHLE